MDQHILDSLQQPGDVAKLSNEELEQLAHEIRDMIVQVVSHNGGHLAPSLGVVELTLALLATFNMEEDKLIWDVGHQSYAYKLLTGRKDKFATLRTLGGLSGFPRIAESPYDHFGVGHSSTSISAALGMAMARDLRGASHHVVAVIGDGALTAGEAFEGLNLAGHMARRLIVILNDNEMSISSNVGALSLILSRTLSSQWMRQKRRNLLHFLRSIPHIGENLALYAQRGEWSFKSFFTPGMLFEALHFTYIGPVDGHDLAALKKNLAMAASVEDGPVLLHVRTIKGKGFAPAEKNPTKYHGVSSFLPETSGRSVDKKHFATFTQVFGETLVKLAQEDPNIIAITAAMPEGTGTDLFRTVLPERFVDVGICEQHAVTFAAGLAATGFKPVVAIYSTFLQRSYDQVIHDVCLQNLPVTFCIDRAGLVGEDGATHHGMFDLAYLRHIPNMHLIAPRDENMLRHALYTSIQLQAPCALRYPRGVGFGVDLEPKLRLLPCGVGEEVQEGEKIAIVACGNRVHPAMEAARLVQKELGFTPLVFDPIWIKPLPAEALLDLAVRFKCCIFVEDGVLAGGFSSAVLELWSDHNLLTDIHVKRIGIPDTFVEHGSQLELREMYGLRGHCIAKTVVEFYRGLQSEH
ncbi:MAG: 1-deoxy-D-xylulose-5-phosphate synthase [Desulfovibrionaceae bacterium]|nr:1-deoxy-D-xylulose-5-phosphate synthase [Desulfovibrionaceae bacterium]